MGSAATDSPTKGTLRNPQKSLPRAARQNTQASRKACAGAEHRLWGLVGLRDSPREDALEAVDARSPQGVDGLQGVLAQGVAETDQSPEPVFGAAQHDGEARGLETGRPPLDLGFDNVPFVGESVAADPARQPLHVAFGSAAGQGADVGRRSGLRAATRGIARDCLAKRMLAP